MLRGCGGSGGIGEAAKDGLECVGGWTRGRTAEICPEHCGELVGQAGPDAERILDEGLSLGQLGGGIDAGDSLHEVTDDVWGEAGQLLGDILRVVDPLLDVAEDLLALLSEDRLDEVAEVGRQLRISLARRR